MTTQEATREMTDNEVTEAYFRALGWKRFKDRRDDGSGHGRNENVTGWVDSDGEEWYDLPNILESNSAFTEHVLEVMEGEGYKLSICEINQTSRGSYTAFIWSGTRVTKAEEIKDNNIFRAAVIAATRYFEEKSK